MTADPVPPPLPPAAESVDPARESASPGRMIRLAREQAGFTIAELATQTKLARGTLEALERDDFSVLTEPVYVRGYYRKCARVLAVSEPELLAGYEKKVAPKAPHMPTKLLFSGNEPMSRTRLRQRRLGGRWVAVVVVAAIIGAAAWFLVNDAGTQAWLSKTPPTSAPPVSPGPPPVELRPSPALASPEAAVSPAPADNGPSAPSAPDSGTVKTVPAPTSSPPVAVVSTGPGSLSLAFKETSWVRVEDADGRVLVSGVIQSGDSKQVRGRPPYSMFIGNAPGVTVEYEGRRIDVTQYVKANSTARFSVP